MDVVAPSKHQVAVYVQSFEKMLQNPAANTIFIGILRDIWPASAHSFSHVHCDICERSVYHSNLCMLCK